MNEDFPKRFHFKEIQGRIYQRWLESGAMRGIPDERENRYVIMMPLPNVTGALHMGHAMDNVMQDLLIRWHRMKGDNTLWMPGTDHAGIATQAVVEKRLFELEGKTRHDIGRDALVERIWRWKDEFQARIIEQQQAMGCSCDWTVYRFTMDAVCARAVREAFFRLFQDGLIYRGNRLVNWDCHLQTAVSDDEIVRKTVHSHFWHIRYPFMDAAPGEPAWVTVATTRPETMLGDTAVAVHPDPERVLDASIEDLEARLATAPEKERPDLEAERDRLRLRRSTHIPKLIQLAAMARDGRTLRLPLLGREIPLILDEWARPELGSGCVKITPAHDPNDYDVWLRHKHEIDIINVLNPDGTYNAHAGPYAGHDRMVVRDRVVADLEAQGLIEKIEDHELELGHSDRSKTPIEPYLSRQWFISMGDRPDGVLFGRGTANAFTAPGLAQAAIDVASGRWRTASGRALAFHPDPERYAGTYTAWLAEKRDWCISRQLWWGHRIPIWHGTISRERLEAVSRLAFEEEQEGLWTWVADEDGKLTCPRDVRGGGPFQVLACIRRESDESRLAPLLEAAGLEQDPDVLDTWFSSALWPFSTLGWPDPDTARVDPGQTPLGPQDGTPSFLDYYYPGSCLVTARDIITLWVARMQLMGLYLLGDVPFTDCFIHANIQDGKGERMSKSKGNGIDPLDIIDEYGVDAMRYVLCDMQTGTQDIKLPVQAISPYTGERIDLATARHGRTIFTYIDPANGKEFDVLGTIDDLPRARVTSDRFEVGQLFCTKLWNAARFALINLGRHTFRPLASEELRPEDRWILSRLAGAVGKVTRALEAYDPAGALATAREFFWGDLCDWYLELVKPRLKEDGGAYAARAVLSVCMDHVLRLFHPFVPFITEALWEKLGEQAPVRGLREPLPACDLLMSATWPEVEASWVDESVEQEVAAVQDVVRAIRDLRAQYQVPSSRQVDAAIQAHGEALARIEKLSHLVARMAGVRALTCGPEVDRPRLSAVAVCGDVEIHVAGVIDVEKERIRLTRQRDKIEKELQRIGKKLANEKFLEKAPADIVNKERARHAELRGQLELVGASLRAFE